MYLSVTVHSRLVRLFVLLSVIVYSKSEFCIKARYALELGINTFIIIFPRTTFGAYSTISRIARDFAGNALLAPFGHLDLALIHSTSHTCL